MDLLPQDLVGSINVYASDVVVCASGAEASSVDDCDFHSEECSRDYRGYFLVRATRDFCDLHSTACSHDNRDYFSSRAARDCCDDRHFNSEKYSHDNRDYFPPSDFRGSCDDRDCERFLAPELCVVDSSPKDRDISPVSRDNQPCDVWSLECTHKGTNTSSDNGTLSSPSVHHERPRLLFLLLAISLLTSLIIFSP